MHQPPEKEPHWVVRGGMATPSQIQAGTARHRGVPDPPGLYGFSVQYQPGKTIKELAVAGKFRNAQISVTTDAALVVAGVSGYPVHIAKSRGRLSPYSTGAFHLPLDLAEVLSAVFTQMPHPAFSGS